jgi:hypothetical protein
MVGSRGKGQAIIAAQVAVDFLAVPSVSPMTKADNIQQLLTDRLKKK